MKIILLKDVRKVGKKNDIVDASEGYARNFLIRNGLAKEISKKEIKQYQTSNIIKENKKEIKNELLKKKLLEIKNSQFILEKKANEKGHLFETVHKKDISKLLDIDEKYITSDINIKDAGEYEINLSMGGLKGKIKLIINQ